MSGARRYGGAHSPGGEPAAASARRRPARRSIRAWLLYIAPTPLLFAALTRLLYGDAVGLVAIGAAWAALMAGAALTREGVRAAREYDARAVARPPAFPRKLFGAALTGLGLAAAARFGGGSGLASSALFGAMAFGLHVLAFGPDPLRSKGINGLTGEALDLAVSRIETARRLIAEMEAAAARLGDREVAERVGRVARAAEDVVALIARDPSDIRRARRLLSVYLVGARDATVKYAQAREAGEDGAARLEFLALLEELEAHVGRSRRAIAEGERAALDIEIEVLRDRLRFEGA